MVGLSEESEGVAGQDLLDQLDIPAGTLRSSAPAWRRPGELSTR